MADNSPHALYRFYDGDGVLLYIGVTADPGVRFKQHRNDKEWWTQVATIRIEKLPTRASVLAAERIAIQEERPLWNVTHNEAAAAIRRSRGNVYDDYGRLVESGFSQWRDLAGRHPQLLAVELYIKAVGDMYIDDYWRTKSRSEAAYICGHAFWYGVGNALDLLGGPRYSNKAITEAVAGLAAGVPLVDEDEDVSQWPEQVFNGPFGFINVLTGKGWNAPAELLDPNAGYVVYQRMHKLMPDCVGPCLCKPQPWSEQ